MGRQRGCRRGNPRAPRAPSGHEAATAGYLRVAAWGCAGPCQGSLRLAVYGDSQRKAVAEQGGPVRVRGSPAGARVRSPTSVSGRVPSASLRRGLPGFPGRLRHSVGGPARCRVSPEVCSVRPLPREGPVAAPLPSLPPSSSVDPGGMPLLRSPPAGADPSGETVRPEHAIGGTLQPLPARARRLRWGHRGGGVPGRAAAMRPALQERPGSASPGASCRVACTGPRETWNIGSCRRDQLRSIPLVARDSAGMGSSESARAPRFPPDRGSVPASPEEGAVDPTAGRAAPLSTVAQHPGRLPDPSVAGNPRQAGPPGGRRPDDRGDRFGVRPRPQAGRGMPGPGRRARPRNDRRSRSHAAGGITDGGSSFGYRRPSGPAPTARRRVLTCSRWRCLTARRKSRISGLLNSG